ncbi:TfoX/Sxy family protein [Larkinella bovis]|uniref:TfoX/Sxy family protein n=1 Tax=Larkinella bovis TaxID=683041 RepID=A0ABW0I9U7_9BACT
MPYNENVAERIRHRLAALPNIEEKKMMGGLVFMYNDKMCVGIMKDDLMCRIDPALHEESVEKTGCRTMDFPNRPTTRPMLGYVLVDETGMRSPKEFDYWIDLALAYNGRAKSSKRKP